jgi:uncharacterized RDD family membrane protein YckC
MVRYTCHRRRAIIRSFRTGTAAAQNHPVIRICPKCGALLLDDSGKCSFCDIPDAEVENNNDVRQPVRVGAAVFDAEDDSDADLNAEPEWRREVSQRLAHYRARRRLLDPEDSQSGLPFRQVEATEEVELPKLPRSRPMQRQRQVLRQGPAERMDIRIQPELDFSAPDDRAHPQTALVPVATLDERRVAGALDTIFLAITGAGFLALFRSLGGEIAFEKVDAVVYLTVLYLFYAQYFFLFTTFAGATPGMQLRGLTIVQLDGSLPDTKQLLWRSFGYLLSGATLMLGFLWALWDEDRFTWQDRISHTYITAANPLVPAASCEVQPRRRTLAHK